MQEFCSSWWTISLSAMHGLWPVCFTSPAQVQLNSTPSSFVVTSVICPTQFLAFPFALSVQMHCSYIPVGLIFRLELSMLGFSRFILVWKSRDSCMFLCWMHASQLDELQNFVCSWSVTSACFWWCTCFSLFQLQQVRFKTSAGFSLFIIYDADKELQSRSASLQPCDYIN